MNKDEILKLVNAGYTRKEIDEMMKEAPAIESKAEEKQESKEEIKEEAKQENLNNDFQASIQKMVDEFKNGLADIKKEIQSSNLKGATIDINEEKPEDILASIINPSYKKEK